MKIYWVLCARLHHPSSNFRWRRKTGGDGQDPSQDHNALPNALENAT